MPLDKNMPAITNSPEIFPFSVTDAVVVYHLLYSPINPYLSISSCLVPLTNIAHSFDNLLRDTWRKEKVDIYS